MDLTSAELNQLLDNMNIGDMLGISDTSAVYEDLAKLVIPKSEEKELKQPTASYNEKRIDNNKEETNIYSEDIDDDEEGDDVDEEDSSYDRFEVEVSDDLEVSLGEMEMELLVNYIPLKVRSLASASTKYAAKSSSKLGLNAMESSTFSFGLEELLRLTPQTVLCLCPAQYDLARVSRSLSSPAFFVFGQSDSSVGSRLVSLFICS